MPKFKVGDKVKAIPAIAEISAPKMKGRVWTVTAVVAGGRRVDLESNGEKLSGILETALTAANAAACNARFKVGDKVVSTSGNRGVVDEVYDHEQYAVRFDGRSMPDRVEGFKLRAANSAYNARFKVGDRVKEVNHPFGKTHTITEVFTDGNVRVDEGKQKYPAAKYARVTSSNSVVNAALAWKQGGEIAKNASFEAVRECNRLKGIANKYGQLFQKMANDIKAFSRECPDATAVTNGDAKGAISAVESLIKWCHETKILSPEDGEY